MWGESLSDRSRLRSGLGGVSGPLLCETFLVQDMCCVVMIRELTFAVQRAADMLSCGLQERRGFVLARHVGCRLFKTLLFSLIDHMYSTVQRVVETGTRKVLMKRRSCTWRQLGRQCIDATATRTRKSRHRREEVEKLKIRTSAV